MPAAAADETYLSLIVPAFNEAGSIARTLELMRNYLQGQTWAWEIIVSADGTDGTRERAAEFAAGDPRIVVIGTPERRGKGRGVRDGVLQAKGQFIGFVDADYKTPMEELEKILPVFDKGFEVVIGSRRVGDSKIVRPQKLYRRLGSKAFAKVMRTIVGLHGIQDTQCGFKFFTRDAARKIFSLQQINGYMFDVEILRLACKLGYGIKEVGVRWQDDGDSRSPMISGTLRHARDLLSIRFMKYPNWPGEKSSPSSSSPRAKAKSSPSHDEPVLSFSTSSGRGPGA
jgi:dolichyl-phosphate beta-glucosyltransferase